MQTQACTTHLHKSCNAWLFAVTVVEEGFLPQLHGSQEVPGLPQGSRNNCAPHPLENASVSRTRLLLLGEFSFIVVSLNSIFSESSPEDMLREGETKRENH